MIFADIYDKLNENLKSEIEINRPCRMIPGRKEGTYWVQDEHGFVYMKDHQMADGSSTWKCKRRLSKKDKCKAVIKVHGETILWQRRTHNHSAKE